MLSTPGRAGEPEEVADMGLFLASEGAGTGSRLSLDRPRGPD